MKLLSINNFHYRRAGSDVLFLAHDRLFQSHGWETAVFSMHHRENLRSPWERFFVQEIELARRHSPGTRLRHAVKVLYSREARTQLRRLLHHYEPDVVHIHSIYHHISPAILPVLGRLGVPIVLTAHDYKLACPAYKMFDGRSICEECRDGSLLPLVRKRCLHNSAAISTLVAIETALHRHLRYYRQYVDRIICPSRFLQEKLAEWGWPRERLVHVRNFFDSTLWSPCFEPGRYFLYFGRLAPEKGLRTLLQACALTQLPVRIIGWGTEAAALRELARTMQAPAEFVEHLPPSELAAHIRSARAVVLPSQWYENASLAILESFACGKPVIASRIGGNPELVSEARNGYLFEPGDVRELAQCLQRTWNMADDQVAKVGRTARADVEAGYSGDSYFEAMTGLYKVLRARRTATHRIPQDAIS